MDAVIEKWLTSLDSSDTEQDLLLGLRGLDRAVMMGKWFNAISDLKEPVEKKRQLRVKVLESLQRGSSSHL
jgi:hypothetical protein